MVSTRHIDRRYVEWDVQNWSQALGFWRSHGRPITGADALEIGSRRGGLSLWLAERGARSVTCSDLGGPDPQAEASHTEAGLPLGRITYEDLDAVDNPHIEQFDIAVFKSVLGGVGSVHGLRGQEAAMHGLHRALRPGGQLWFAENLVASPLHEFARRRFVSWGDRWRYVTLSEVQAMLRPFASVEWATFGLAGAFGRNERQREVLGRLDRSGLDRVAPRQWRYIVAGVATK